MTLLGSFKQPSRTTCALAVGAAALVTSVGVAVVVYNQQKNLSELRKITDLNAGVTLHLADLTGRMMKEQNQ